MTTMNILLFSPVASAGRSMLSTYFCRKYELYMEMNRKKEYATKYVLANCFELLDCRGSTRIRNRPQLPFSPFKTDPTHTAFAPCRDLGYAEKVTHAYLPLGLKIMSALLITWPKCDYNEEKKSKIFEKAKKAIEER
jgi:hypothetical protein